MEKLHGPDKDPHPESHGDRDATEQANEIAAFGASDKPSDSPKPLHKLQPNQNSTDKSPASIAVANSHASHAGKTGHGRKGAQVPHVYAALDLGTNNCRLLIAHPTRRSFRVIGAFSRIIRLGEGISRNGSLSDAAMKRTIEALKICSEKMIRFNVIRSRLVATEACRAANNSEDFIARVKAETGLKMEVINQETEARLAVSGCASLLDRKSDGAVVFDIGGGSSELIWLDLRNAHGRWRKTIHDRIEAQKYIRAWTSLPIGVVSLAEKFGGRVVNGEIYEQMVEYVLDALKPFENTHRIGDVIRRTNMHMLGTSGTVTTVAGVYLKLDCYQRHRVDGLWMTAKDVCDISRKLSDMSYDQRVAQPCIGADRADLVLAGCAILEALIRMWPCERLRVADRGLREGILAGLMVDGQRK